jgi:ABC-type sugar transport system substrate-binding protein
MKYASRATTRWAIALASAASLLAAGASQVSARSHVASAASGKKLVLVQLQSAPFYSQMQTGFKAAAAAQGFSVSVTGPPQLNPSTAVSDTQDAISAGTNGLLVSAFGSFTPILNGAIKQNIAVCTVDVSDPGSKVPCHVGSPTANEGAALAKYFATKLGAHAKGDIVSGICVPGYPPLAAKITGFDDEMKTLEPGVKVLGPYNVTGAPTTNQAAWLRLASQNPKAIGFFGACDQDLPSLVRMKQQSKNAHYLIGAVAGGDDPTAMAAIRSGVLTAAINQHGYVDGYVGATLLIRHILHGTALPVGWLNTQFDLVTKANVNKIASVVNTATAGNGKVAATYYAPLIKSILAKPKSAVAGPVTSVTKLGASSLSQPYPGP